MSGHVGRRPETRRNRVGELISRRRAADVIGKCAQGTGRSAARLIQELGLDRVEWWWPERLGWPE
jgi:hypothetical protein